MNFSWNRIRDKSNEDNLMKDRRRITVMLRVNRKSKRYLMAMRVRIYHSRSTVRIQGNLIGIIANKQGKLTRNKEIFQNKMMLNNKDNLRILLVR